MMKIQLCLQLYLQYGMTIKLAKEIFNDLRKIMKKICFYNYQWIYDIKKMLIVKRSSYDL